MEGTFLVRDVDILVREIRRRGHRAELGRRAWKVYAPLGVVFLALNPSDWRAVKNMIRDLKRAGLDLKDPP